MIVCRVKEEQKFGEDGMLVFSIQGKNDLGENGILVFSVQRKDDLVIEIEIERLELGE